MQDFQQYHKVIKERIVSPGAFYYADPWWDAEIKQFTLDVSKSIHFIDNECSDEELYWLSEVFDDIMDRSRSKEFLECLRRRAQKVEDSKWREEILEDIRTAAEYVE